MGKSEGQAWRHFETVTRPTLILAPSSFLDDIAASLSNAGIQEAVARRDSGPIFDWLMSLFQLQGISDAVAFAYAAERGSVRWHEIETALFDEPECWRLTSYWHFHRCRFEKSAWTCSEPHLLHRCTLPRHPLRNGRLNQAAYSLFLFIRDICDSDLIGWIDHRLERADIGPGQPGRAEAMRNALLHPMSHIFGVSYKVLSMTLADLLLCGDPSRERWVTTGTHMIAVDTLVHNFLHRTGVLHRFDALHEFGPDCYGPRGCAGLIKQLAERIDARAFNPSFPKVFPRFVQSALWRFCAGNGLDICNGNRIDDTVRCRNIHCPAHQTCDRLALRIEQNRA
ncbi:hypothetical protein [Microvirga pudoricolor]|uniref:hypothetical protein n=1 Tax=Microvirga pudoricolor TaxID=2778729 RepID=UPI00194DB88B|nr:hypothetical protein [Microvirga pudoricolor]MBM6596503.1 hypothetical protein [Microvirga pudoricolor]